MSICYYRSQTTGNTSSSLEYIDGSGIADTDSCLVISNNSFEVFRAKVPDTSSTNTSIIQPLINGDSVRWHKISYDITSVDWSGVDNKPTVNNIITLSGDCTGSGTLTMSELGQGTANIAVTVADDSHNHVIANIDGLQDALDAKAGLDSAQLTGSPLCPTANAASSQYHIANRAYVAAAIAEMIDSAPSTLDTLNELAAALGDDPNFATTITALIGAHTANTSNPHNLTANTFGLGNVTNESKATMFTNPNFTGTPTIANTSIFASIGNYLHPVGSIFETLKTGNPNTYFGFGTWDYLGQGRVTVCIDSSDDSFDTLEETGGEKTHTLTVNELPSHNHVIDELRSSTSGTATTNIALSNDGSSTKGSYVTANTGGDQAHNILQPYIVVNRWWRSA